MTAQFERAEKITTRILEALEAGRTNTSICAAKGMPSLSTFQRWCRSDREFDDAIFGAMTRGLFIQLHTVHDKQEAAVNQLIDPDQDTDPKSMQALATILRDQNHNKVALLTRLDKRFQDKIEVSYEGPMVIGWQNAVDTCPNGGHDLTDSTMRDVTPPLTDKESLHLLAPHPD